MAGNTDIFYNARGQRTKISYANGVLTEYTYDPKTFRLTKLVSTRTSDSAVLQDLRYWYDPVGNIVETKDYADADLYLSGTSPFASADSKYEYDALYRLTYAEGREHPSIGGTQQRESDLAWAALPHPNDTQALRRYVEEYSYDGVGNILELAHTAGTDSWTRWYQYATASNKLTGTSDSGDSKGARYADTTSYTDHYTHDARGNIVSMPHLAAMDWDFADRLQHCDLLGGGDVYFTYDAAGQRVRKVWVNNTTSIVDEQIYVGGYEVWRHRVSGTLDEERQTLHVMDDQRRVAMVETKTVAGGSTVSSPTSYQRFQLDDHLGSARVEVDGSGALLTYEEYHPYGTTAFRASSGASGFAPKRYRYTGKERDEETGLYYYGARYYPPWLGRWTAVDPAGSGINAFEYCSGNPVMRVDPDGREDTAVPYDPETDRRVFDPWTKAELEDTSRRPFGVSEKDDPWHRTKSSGSDDPWAGQISPVPVKPKEESGKPKPKKEPSFDESLASKSKSEAEDPWAPKKPAELKKPIKVESQTVEMSALDYYTALDKLHPLLSTDQKVWMTAQFMLEKGQNLRGTLDKKQNFQEGTYEVDNYEPGGLHYKSPQKGGVLYDTYTEGFLPNAAFSTVEEAVEAHYERIKDIKVLDEGTGAKSIEEYGAWMGRVGTSTEVGSKTVGGRGYAATTSANYSKTLKKFEKDARSIATIVENRKFYERLSHYFRRN